jgi:hypothetical protein
MVVLCFQPPGFRLPVDSELDRAFQFSESSDEQQRADLFAKFRLEQNRLRAHFEREWRRVHLKFALFPFQTIDF